MADTNLTGLVAQGRTIAGLVGMNATLVGGLVTGSVLRDPRRGRNLGCAVAFDLALALAGVRVEVRGTEHLDAPRPAVFAFNHQSNLDPLVVCKLVRRDFTSTGKAEVRKDPAAMLTARALDAVLIDRGDPEAARAQMARAAQRLRDGESILIAPEGTRTRDAEPGPYRTGVVHLALAGRAPIVPVVLKGAGAVMPGRVIHPGTVEVTVLPAIPTDGWDPKDARRHAGELRDVMVAELRA